MSSSSSEDSDAGRKRKRKVRRLEDSPTSTSSASPIIGNSSLRLRKRHGAGGSSNESDHSPILTNHRKKIMKVTTDSESDSDSDSDIGHSRITKPRPLETDSDTDDGSSSQWESDFSDQESNTLPNNSVLPTNQNDSESEFSDGQSEKCPICLVSFKHQEIGTPESCDHTFCLECIQEWSNNMNTCPVDRQEYSLILVRDHLNGKVTRQIPIERPVPQNEVDIFEDPTFCEICGSNDQEDRMLLCDGCDLGFHLFCLTPPLSEVPAGSWYCNDCFSQSDNNTSMDMFELQLLFQEDDEPVDHQIRPQRRTRSTRLIPRTRQTERIRRRVENNRHQNALANQTPQTHSSAENSRNTNRVTSSTSRTKRSKRKSRKSKSTKKKYKTVYKIDKDTGLTVAVKKYVSSKKSRKTKRHVAKPKTVKTRLAQQLGMCAPRTTNQNLPDVKIPNRASSASGNINGIRHDAGIPTLHLFGQNNELDYFTDEDEYSLGSQVLVRRAPTRSEAASIRRTLTRKSIIVPEVVSSTSDLLDSILSSQEQLYARNASYSIDSSGKFKIDAKSKSKNYIDVTKEQVKGKETPYYNPNRNYNRYNQNQNNYNRPYQNRYQRPSNNYYHSNNQNYNSYNTEPSSSMNYSNYSNEGGDDYPQDYSRRTLCATSDPNSEENEEEGNQNEESELDIYSDIETVTTTKAEESEYRPLSPPPLPNFSSMGCLEEDNDSEPDMVIDDEKIQEQDNAETAVSSTVGFEPVAPVPSVPVPFPTLTNPIQLDPVQSSLDTIKSSYQYYNEDSSDGCPNANVYSKEPPKPPNDEDADSDDGCPNFSIYSKESKTVALHTDISNVSTEKQDYQVGEVSSSPNFKSQHCEDQQPDPASSDQMYDPEETFNESEDDETVGENQEETNLTQNRAEEFAPNVNQEDEEKEKEKTVADKSKEQDVHEPQEQSPDENKDQHLDETEPNSAQMYNPEALYSPERDVTTPANLDYTYDPENCIRTDETLNTDVEKTIDADNTTFDPENTFDETNDSIDRTADMEKAIFGFKKSDNNDTVTEDRYDPALPFSDDIDDQQINDTEEGKAIGGEAAASTDPQTSSVNESSTSICEPAEEEIKKVDDDKKVKPKKKRQSNLNSLYSDSEDDESVVKKDGTAFAVNDINQMTEDISEEERSYTPCLDEKNQKEGLEGLDTELISDEDRNDFDEANELKTADDGDALEINAKESELDLARPEDYEEGEIVDKSKDKETPEEEPAEEPNNNVSEQSTSEPPPPEPAKKSKKKDKEKSPERERERDKGNNKENENSTRNSFKRLSKSNKDRNYRDKEKRPSSPKDRSKERDYNNKKDRRKEKRREIERYNVRAIISEKPRPLIAKDQFGRDIRNTPSRSRSRSYTPPLRSSSGPARSPSKSRRSRSRSRHSLSRHRSLPKEKTRKRRKSRSRNYRSVSRSRSPQHKKGSSAQKSKKRKRSAERYRKRKSDDKFGKSKRRVRSRSRHVSRSATPMRRPRVRERLDWTPMDQPQMSPSWTPPRVIDNAQLLRNKNLTVTVNNSKKKKDRRKRRNKDTLETRQKKRRQERDRTPPLSKEVFASGDNILVSVSFNNDNEVRDITTRDKRKNDEINKRRKKRKNRRDLSGVKPVAIIDLDRSPFRELTPSPKQVIVLTDSDNDETEIRRRNVPGSGICDSSQQVASPERGIGPKTPPEPQVKFSLAPKPPQIRAINNPLIDPEEIEINVSNEMASRISPGIHKGPNTPPEPPNSPPSSPDAYDPFEPTKSRSPTPGPQSQDGVKEKHDSIDSRAAIDLLEKSMNPMPEINKSLTPPLADIQPADSQSSVQVVTPDSNIDKSPDRSQLQTAQQTSKPVAQTIPFSSVPTPLNSSTPIVTNLPPSRINILNSTVISPPVASPIPQRIVLPNQIKSSSVKISPTKTTIKSTPIKPMLSKTTTTKFTTRKRTQNGSADDILLDFDSPYSPGSSDYEDLFEPPSEIVTKPVIKGKAKTVQKHPLSAFDALFGGSPSYKKKKYPTKKMSGSGKTKMVGVRLDEDNLKILDEVPNSAVEMQVKDKFLKKLNRQERVVEEVKLVLKPHYNKKRINKEEYKDILRRSVPKICHNKSGEINPTKIKNLIEAYVRKIRHSKKVTSSSNINPQKM